MAKRQQILDITPQIIVDLFAGGGGVSEGVEMALGFPPHVAVNHNDHALSMHRVNHPFTRHHIADVFEICPKGVVAFHRRPVGALHLSPDCTHFSQSSAGQPRDRKIRALSWVAVRWAGQVKPHVITLENVKQILKWGPLVAKRDKVTGRVVKLDGSVAAPGERVPVQEQFLVPDPKRVGRTWRRFVATLEGMGYTVEWRMLVAADYGVPTTRERLFMIARCDGRRISWPEATHARTPRKGQKRWKPAADCIDWSIPCPSIFERKKPLAPATMKRIARGMKRYVLDSADPFVVPIAHSNGSEAEHSVRKAARSVTAIPKGGTFAVAAPTIVPAAHQAGDRVQDSKEPLPSITAAHRGESMVSAAYLMQANGGFNETPGHDAREPMSTITNRGSQQQLVTAFLAAHYTEDADRCRSPEDPVATVTTANRVGLVAAHLAHLRGNCDARDLDDPLQTVSASGQHHAVVVYRLSPEHEAGALRVAAFLMEYYSEGGQWSDLRDPVHTITTKDRLALVTVTIQGTPYVVVDIGLRMLTPRELYRAQGFREDYIIDYGHDGRKFTKDQQVRMVGNSVPPDVIAAIYRANLGEMALRHAARTLA
ncbi:MAG: DNA cytosine methyltransferase [Pseudomonadota bacterium]